LAQGLAVASTAMQRLISIVALVGAVVQLRSPEPADVSETREELQQLNKQLNAALSVKDQEKTELTAANARVTSAQKRLSAEKEKYTSLQKKLEDIKKKDGVEEMKIEVSKDQQEEAKLAAENSKLMQKLEDVRSKARSLTDEKEKLAEEDKASSTKLHELVNKMQSALSVATGAEDAASAAASPATAGSGKASTKAYLQMDPEPVMDKVPSGGVPEQGFEGVSVEHKDGETQTGDWGKEYGRKKHPVPSSAFGPALCLALYAIF